MAKRKGSASRMALLEAMKMVTPLTPGARQDFRADVGEILESWDGKSPMLWFVYEHGTHLIDLFTRKKSDARRVEREFELASGYESEGLYLIEDYAIQPVEVNDARQALESFYA